MTSLLERMNLPSAGPARSSHSTQASRSSTPYNRSSRPPKGDIESPWSHDLFEADNSKAGSLSARLSTTTSAPRANFNSLAVKKALRDVGASPVGSELAIKGAAAGNVVEVTGLADGTSAADVSAIFKSCGQITSAATVPNRKEITIRVTFKQASHATAAVAKFDKQPADGKTLSVKVIGSAATGLGGRLGDSDGLGLVRQEGTVDILMESSTGGSSKMRSDALVSSDPRAQVLVAPPGANPADYTRLPGGRQGGRRGRGKGTSRGGLRRGGSRTKNMEVD